MAAAGIRPQASAVIFRQRPSLQEHLSPGIEDEYTEGPMQQRLSVSFHLLHGPNFFIKFVHKHHRVCYHHRSF
jgi:hypothetical protein